uniref:Putative membrane protein insertion efficiency factor n=1 Tax=candidate division WOR-3 bacterium TaxID=2052148 RepID=A0A7C4CBX2_UNCW3
MITRLLRFLVHLYRYTLGTVLPNSCRFQPSCSAYALEALEKHGPGRGSWLTLKRIARCNPLFPGGHDPVPDPATTRCKPQIADTGDPLEV